MTTLDKASEQSLTSVIPELAALWKRVFNSMWAQHEMKMKITDSYRSMNKQNQLYSLGRCKAQNGQWLIIDSRKIVTWALPGSSYHQYALAVDACFVGADPYLERIDKKHAQFLWSEYGRMCIANGLEWGGSWHHPDRPHCQLSFGLTLNELQGLHKTSGVPGVWDKCHAIMKEKNLILV